MDLGILITIIASVIAVGILIIQLLVEKRKGTFDSNKMSIKLGLRDKKYLKDSIWSIGVGIEKPKTDKIIFELPIIIENTSNIVRKNILVNLILPTKYVIDLNDEEFFKTLDGMENRPESEPVKRWISNGRDDMVEISYKIDYISPKSFLTIGEPITLKNKELINIANLEKKDLEKVEVFKVYLKLFNKKSKPIYRETNMLFFLSASRDKTVEFLSKYFSFLLSTEIKNRYYNLKPGIYYIPFFIKIYEKFKFRKFKFNIVHISTKVFRIKSYLFSMSDTNNMNIAVDDMTFLLKHSRPKISEIFNLKRKKLK